MKINEFGTENEKSMLLIATAALEPDWAFIPAIELLARDYHVYAAVADGHSAGGSYAGRSLAGGSSAGGSYAGRSLAGGSSAGASVRSFTSVERTAADIDFALGRKGVTHLDAAYGLSMGGAILLRFLTTSGIKVDKAVIDGGITPYPYPAWICRLISLRDFALAWPMTRSRKLLEKVAPPEKYTPAGHDPAAEYDALMDFYRNTYKARSIYNDFWSANNYELPNPAPALDTEITYWYAEKEAKARKEDMDFLKGYLSNVTFTEIPGYEHGELVMVYPDDFYRIFTATISSFTAAQNA
jgi:pimeloyl-ACP methyl ester carboxylesterase